MFNSKQTAIVQYLVDERIRRINDALPDISDTTYAWSLLIQEREELRQISQRLQGVTP
jgi:hypothetical protein